jgi:hypothetical protein
MRRGRVNLLISVARTGAIAVAIALLTNLCKADEKNSDGGFADQAMPVDALGYLGGLFEARFYQPHTTTNDPRDEIRQAALLYGVDLPMMMSIAKVESDFNPLARTGSYKGLFQLSDYEFEHYGDGSIWDARDNARAAAHIFLNQAEKFKWALGHYPDYAERYMVHQQGIEGAIEHYQHPERVAWQSMCATGDGIIRGEQWCKRCIWGNLLPGWKRAFGSVENILSGDFVSLWTERIDHLADRFSVARNGAFTNPSPKGGARLPAIARWSNFRPPRAGGRQLHAVVALAGSQLPHSSRAITRTKSGVRIAHTLAGVVEGQPQRVAGHAMLRSD